MILGLPWRRLCAQSRALRCTLSTTLFLLLANPHDLARAQCADYGAGLRWVGFANEVGSPDDMVVEGSLLYAAWGTGFAIFDLSTPARPTRLGITGTPGWSYGVAVAGSLAYVASSDGLHVIDVSDPAAPVFVSSVVTFGRDARDVVVIGSHAYVADGAYGISVFDISNPEAPRLVQGFETPGYANEIAFAGSTLYVANGDQGLWVLDLQHPTIPRSSSSVDTPGDALGVAVAGAHAYVADRSGGLQVVDVSDAAHPTWITGIDASVLGSVQDLAITGTVAYVSTDSGLAALDISDPASPRILDRAVGWGECVTAAGPHVYVGKGAALDVFEFSGPNVAAIELGAVSDLPEISDLVAAGSLAFVAEESDFDDGTLVRPGGLRIVDATDPNLPRLIGSVELPDGLSCVAVFGSHVFAGSRAGLVRSIDVSTPASPTVLGVAGIGPVYDLAVSGPFVYAIGFDTGVHVIDVSTMNSPVVVGTLDSLHSRGLAVSGSLVYVRDRDRGLVIVDASDPANPMVVGSVNGPWAAGGRDLVVAGSHVYLSSYLSRSDGSLEDGFWVIDVADPASPTVVAHIPCRPGDVAVQGAQAYIATEWGLVLIDISKPTAPEIVGGFSGFGRASPVAVAGAAIYSGGVDGLHVLRSPCESTPVEVSDLTAEPHDEGILVRWRTSGASFIRFEVLRSSLTLGRAERRGEAWEFWDRSAPPGTTFSYEIVGTLEDGRTMVFGPVVAGTLLPRRFVLDPVWPFPAREAATISFALPRAEAVRVEIYDARGRRIRRLLDARREPGRHLIRWDGRGEGGDAVGSGIYFVRLSWPAGALVMRTAMVR